MNVSPHISGRSERQIDVWAQRPGYTPEDQQDEELKRSADTNGLAYANHEHVAVLKPLFESVDLTRTVGSLPQLSCKRLTEQCHLKQNGE